MNDRCKKGGGMKKSGTFKELSAEELNRWIEEEKAFHLIDTLLSDHFEGVHLPNAGNACVFQVTFIDQVTSVTDDKNSEIVLYGAGAGSMDAVTAAGKLAQEGYGNIHVLKGGLEAWRAAGLPLEGNAVDQALDPGTLLKLEDRSYRVDTDRSGIEWRGRNPNSTHFGTVGVAGGELMVRDGVVTGVFDIDMESITNINLEGDESQPILIAHLESDDFFLTKRFPRARFEIDRGLPSAEPFLSLPNYEISGSLELRGVKARQDFMATITKTPENGLAAEAHFDIDRTKWGVVYGSARFFQYLGMHLVFDLISLQVRIVAN